MAPTPEQIEAAIRVVISTTRGLARDHARRYAAGQAQDCDPARAALRAELSKRYEAAHPVEMCPACKVREKGDTIALCLSCHWQQAVDGIGEAVDMLRGKAAA